TEAVIRRAGPLLAPFAGAPGETVQGLTTEQALAAIDSSGLRGRGGAYFPTGRKWRAALEEGRPIALVVNAEEGEPGTFKDRVLLSLRLERFLDGLAIAQHVLRPTLCIIFVNGEARDIIASLEARLAEPTRRLPVEPRIIAGGGGYVLGEESTMLNAIEGRKPVPRLRPPYPVEFGLFGMPTVINNAETIAQLSVVFQHGPAAFTSVGTAEAPGTKLFSISGRVPHPGLYEAPLGATVAEVIEMAGAPLAPPLRAVLCGGPSGGFLPPAELHRPLLPGPLHPTGAIAGSGGLVVLDSTSDLRQAAIAMADYNARESCGKCTPCREGAPRLVDALESRDHSHLDDLLEVVGAASLCGLGQAAPGPIRSAMYFWPEAFA
ncbi:MAG: NADH-ubiquinone oxidoreductase-F iron-sulfur binding region domain-containing protein, partial [Dehalococcoidia bacterium]